MSQLEKIHAWTMYLFTNIDTCCCIVAPIEICLSDHLGVRLNLQLPYDNKRQTMCAVNQFFTLITFFDDLGSFNSMRDIEDHAR